MREWFHRERKIVVETIQTVYLDEAGFTGNNLLDPAQPMFVYSAVAMAKDQAAALHSEVVSRFRLRDHELKGSNLVKRRQGREAISWLLARSGEYALVAVYDKRYALAGRFLRVHSRTPVGQPERLALRY